MDKYAYVFSIYDPTHPLLVSHLLTRNWGPIYGTFGHKRPDSGMLVNKSCPLRSRPVFKVEQHINMTPRDLFLDN
jgi:hypothetical protein